MSTAELLAPEVAAPAQILEIVDTAGLATESAVALKSQLAPFFIQAQEWQAKLSTITDAKDARESRLLLRKVRVDAEHKKDSLKKTALAYTSAVDACFRLIKATVEPMEATLLEIEKEAERAEALRKTKVRDERAAQLVAVGFDPSFTALADIPEEAFQVLLKQQTEAHEIRQAAARKAAEDARIAAEKAEADRIAREQAEAAERERIRAENEQLKREAAEREEAARIERERAEKARLEAEEAARIDREKRAAELAEVVRRAEAKRAEAEAKAKAEREALEAAALAASLARQQREEIERKAKEERDAAELVARQERQARENAEAELRAIHEAKLAKEKADQEAAERAALAPDKDRLLALAVTIRGISIPFMGTPKGKARVKEIAGHVADLARLVDQHAREL
jgi:chemosensory pili system protein ChpA (sensor histidine kinase/response regulator)